MSAKNSSELAKVKGSRAATAGETANGGGADARFGAALKPGERSPAPYAASAMPSRGRFYPEPECPTRSPFQRDRDRVLHSTAFRRLTYKTQVFLPHEGDHYRTRLTHSLEVAQIARTIARQLRLDEDLAETIALAHDLGHSPFGHAGERALDRAMRDFGGFDHNAQSLRVVTGLERKYLAFDGLNLSWESLEGIAKHNGPIAHDDGAVAKVTRRFEGAFSMQLRDWPSAEAQVASLADDIAYLTHDVDDGLRAGFLTVEMLHTMPVAAEIAKGLIARDADATGDRVIYEITRRMITVMISDVVAESRRLLSELAPQEADDIRKAGRASVAFSRPMGQALMGLKSFLFDAVYHHRRMLDVMMQAEGIVSDLFARYNGPDGIELFPAPWQVALKASDRRRRARLACDYLAGETDRFALAEHRHLFDESPELR